MNHILTSLVSLAALWTSAPAHAFCGTYVGGAGAEIYNNVAQVAIVRRGSRTVLSIANDIEGDTSDFALVVPVPEVLPESAIHVLEPELFARLDSYSEPRLVRYECEDFERDDELDDGGDGGGSDGADGGDGGDVDVEAEYIVGEYQIVILSATESEALFTWLEGNGYAVPESTVPLLQEYLDAGAYFFAAKVSGDADIGSGDTLSPLQFAYDSAVFSLPVRLGTANSPGEQDLIIYGVNEFSAGRMGISNYPEVSVEDECLWMPDGEESLATFYADRFTEAWSASGQAAWAVEYAWGASGCDPCTGEPPDLQDLVSLGFDPYETGEPAPNVRDVFFTRLHMRYTPAQATQDLALYQSGLTDQQQVRYIEHETFLEDRWPICTTGWADDPGSCDSTEGTGDGSGDGPGGDWDDDDNSADDGDNKGSGCSTAGSLAGGVALVLALAGALRRREVV
jgi:hypothetical protein